MLKLKEGLKKQSILSILFKFITLFSGYLSIRVLLNYLGPERYGLWVTMTSIFGCFSILDIGIGAGMQNQLVKSYVSNNANLSKKLVSTTYGAMIVISSGVFLAGLLLIALIPVSKFIDTVDLNAGEIHKLTLIMLSSASVLLLINIYINICNSLKRTATALMTGMISQLFILAGFIILNRIGSSKSLILTAGIRYPLNISIIIVMTFILFHSYPVLKPAIKFFDKSLIKRILPKGFQFFIIHLCWVIINSTDNIIISNRLGSSEVTTFSLVFKILSLGKIFYFSLLTPFWPQFSEYYYKKNLPAMKSLIKQYFGILLIVDLLIIIFSFFLPSFLSLWTGKNFIISKNLIIFTCLFIIIDNIVGLFTYCLNAINHVKIQMYLYILGGICNIPLSLFLVSSSLGSAGVVLASCICYIPLLIFMPFQVNYELGKVKTNNA